MLPLADHHPRREDDVKFYEASSTISAKPDAIWGILTDGANYAHWDSGVERVEGRIAPGETIKVFVKVNPGRAFPVKVIEFKPGQRMVWSGGMPLGLSKACGPTRYHHKRTERRNSTCARNTPVRCSR
jgi:hypothetical protein